MFFRKVALMVARKAGVPPSFAGYVQNRFVSAYGGPIYIYMCVCMCVPSATIWSPLPLAAVPHIAHLPKSKLALA